MNARLVQALATGLVLAFIGVSGWYYQNYNLQNTDPAIFAQQFAERLAIMSAWVAAWSWISHVARGRAQVSRHIAVTAAAGLIDVSLLIVAMPWLFFALAWPWPHAFNDITRAVLVIAVSLLQLRLAWGLLNRRLVSLWAMAGCVALVCAGLNNWADQNGTESLSDLPYQVNIYPAYWVMPPEPNLDKGLDALFKKAGWVD